MRPEVLAHDHGLGTAYERYHFYRLLDAWAKKYGIESVVEGPVDGMAGVPGTHSVGLAMRGVKVTAFVRNEEQAGITKAIYDGCEAPADVRVLTDLARIEDEVPAADLVIAYHAISFVDDWPKYLERLAKKAKKALAVMVCNPDNWGVRALEWAARFRGVNISPPDEWRTKTLAPVLWSLGQVSEHEYFDCPWWPDMPVSPGQTLKDTIFKIVTGKNDLAFASKSDGAKLAETFVYGPGHWPYFGGPGFREELEPALKRHPSFENAPPKLRALAGHLHAFWVDVTPRTPQARRRLV